MKNAGLIESYRATINLKKLAPHVTLFVVVELSDHTSASFRVFEAAIDPIEEIVGCWAVGGGFDYLLQIIARDIDEYQRLFDDLLEARIGVARYFTYIVTKCIKQGGTPPLTSLLESSEETSFNRRLDR